MQDPQLQDFKQKLFEMRRRVAEEYNQITQSRMEGLQIAGDKAVAPTHNADHDVETPDIDARLERSEAGLIQAIDAAVERINRGVYGLCANCDREIPQERLEILPYAAYCVECETQREKEGLSPVPEVRG